MPEAPARPRSPRLHRNIEDPWPYRGQGSFLAVSLLPVRYRLVYHPQEDEEAGGPKTVELVDQPLPLLGVGEAVQGA